MIHPIVNGNECNDDQRKDAKIKLDYDICQDEPCVHRLHSATMMMMLPVSSIKIFVMMGLPDDDGSSSGEAAHRH